MGKVLAFHDGGFRFVSSGFVFRQGGGTHVITAYHTLEKIRREYGWDIRVFIQLADRDAPLPLELAFTEPLEDSAVFTIPGEPPGGMPENEYAFLLTEGQEEELLIIGYSDTTHLRHEPDIIGARLISAATLNFVTDVLSLPPDLDPEDSPVILAGGGYPLPGMSGGPVVRAGDHVLVGMTKGFAKTSDHGLLEGLLGASEFHIVVRLENTIRRLETMSPAP